MSDILDDPFVSVPKVAEAFDVTPYTVRQWIRDGSLAATKVNNQWKIRKSEVTRYANIKYGDNT